MTSSEDFLLRDRRWRSVVALVLFLVLSSSRASAYCRATSCDVSTGTCTTDAHGCETEGTAIGKTILYFGDHSGEIYDADIALNSGEYPFSLTSDGADLVAVLTHETGHALGLAHSDVPGATMQPETQGFATAELRTLKPDDVAGICAIYPPGSDSPPVGDPSGSGSSGGGGCSFSRSRPTPRSVALACALFGFIACSRRRGRG